MSAFAITTLLTASLAAASPGLTISGGRGSDLAGLLGHAGIFVRSCNTPAEAIAQAPAASAVLLLAEGYPERQTEVSAALLDAATRRGLTLYIEYPAAISGIELGAPAKVAWERGVVSNGSMGAELPPLRIMGLHDCRYLPAKSADPMLVLAHVAGFDTAVFGLPEARHAILFEIPDRKLFVATTRLSSFITGRYAPLREWRHLWERLLARLDPGLKEVRLDCTPLVRPTLGRDEAMPADAERRALRRAAEWCFASRLLIHPSREADTHAVLRAGRETMAAPPTDIPVGDGRCGIVEGFASSIAWDGAQQQRAVIRADCNTESAMLLAVDAWVHGDANSRTVAGNLLDYVYFTSELCGGPRGNPEHPAFGLVAWGAIAPAWRIANYGDDNGRVIQSSILAAACLGADRWDERILRALLANLRTTGRFGFRGERIDVGPLEQAGWRHYHEASTVFYAPHFEAALWACNLWAYARTREPEFLEKARTAIGMTMAAYPDKWLWGNDLERARMVLALAWLVRVEDTPEHRAWLKRMVGDLLAHQDACGAIPARLGVKGNGFFLAPTSNAEYGTREVPLIQENGDPVSDQLYTTGFALLALHEAAAATGERAWREAEDHLAAFVCRIQVRSERLPWLDGGWFRGFDYGRWDYWAGSGDVGWGAWCIEAGWAQAWAAATLGLRDRHTSMWDLTAGSGVARHLAALQALMKR